MNAEHKPFDVFNPVCPAHEMLDLIASKWTSLILCLLSQSPQRFKQLQRRIDGISEKMLYQTLRKLEADGLITRTVLGGVPPHVEYRLSAEGEGLHAVLRGLCDWVVEYLERRRAGSGSPATANG